MPRHAKGPRLYLRRGRVDARTGKSLPDIYFIRDGQTQVSTGCGPDSMREAEAALAEYIAAKHTPSTRPSADSRSDPAQVLVADVLALYATERAPELDSDPVSIAGFIGHVLAWWGEKTLAEVKRSTCKEYVKHRTAQNVVINRRVTSRLVSDQTARRELEVLSSAIGYWHGEDTLSTRPVVWLPEKRESPRDAITRAQAARLLMAARGYRVDPAGGLHPSGRPRWVRLRDSGPANRAHLKRFVLLGLYTGSRSAVNLALLWSESATQAWADLDDEMIYRRGRQERERANKRRPVVKIPRRLLSHMRRWKQLDEAKSERLGWPINAVIHHGGVPIATKVNKGFAAMVADAGLPAEITPHWLRHTCATWLMQKGCKLWEAAAFTGMTAKMLEDNYGHHHPDYQAAAAKAASGRR